MDVSRDVDTVVSHLRDHLHNFVVIFVTTLTKKKSNTRNLPPKILFNGGKKLEIETRKILNKFSDNHFIFNLSHGIMPGTSIKNVQKLIKIIRNHKNEI